MALQYNYRENNVLFSSKKYLYNRLGYARLQLDEHRIETCVFINFRARKPSMICTNPREERYQVELSSFILHGTLMRRRTVQSQTEMEHMPSKQNCTITSYSSPSYLHNLSLQNIQSYLNMRT